MRRAAQVALRSEGGCSELRSRPQTRAMQLNFPSPSLCLFQVTLMLLDQNNREHIIDAFRPDVTSSSFQQPISEMNIASGCPLFCPLAKLAGKSPYLKDDTIFIKAIVDLTGL